MTDGNELFMNGLNLDALNKRFRAQLINSLTGFKPLNLVGTVDQKGRENLCIVSSVIHLGSDPSLFGMVFRPDVVPRHTLQNIRQTKVWTLNHVNEGIFLKAHQTSARYPQEISEFDSCGLEAVYLNDFAAPYVGESNIKLGFELEKEIEIEANGTHFVIGKLKNLYIPKEVQADDGYVDIEKAGTICGSGLDSYHRTTRLGRLSYAKPDSKPTILSVEKSGQTSTGGEKSVKNLSNKSLAINSNWTSREKSRKWKHYRIAGKRQTGNSSEYEMMAVCDKKDRFWVSEVELSDQSQWQTGWL